MSLGLFANYALLMRPRQPLIRPNTERLANSFGILLHGQLISGCESAMLVGCGYIVMFKRQV